MGKASRLVEQLETQLEQARAALKKKDERLKKLSEQLRELGVKYEKTKAELDALRKIKPSTIEFMDVYNRFICANPIERKGLAVQLALRMPEACLCIHKLEAENADLRNQLRDALERC
jgi:DNA repair exonuclease SbcCD ATPase subunit